MRSAFKLRSGNSPLYKDLGPKTGKEEEGGKSFEEITSKIASKPGKTAAKIELTGYNPPTTTTTKQSSTYVKPPINPTIELSEKGPTIRQKIKSKITKKGVDIAEKYMIKHGTKNGGGKSR